MIVVQIMQLTLKKLCTKFEANPSVTFRNILTAVQWVFANAILRKSRNNVKTCWQQNLQDSSHTHPLLRVWRTKRQTPGQFWYKNEVCRCSRSEITIDYFSGMYNELHVGQKETTQVLANAKINTFWVHFFLEPPCSGESRQMSVPFTATKPKHAK